MRFSAIIASLFLIAAAARGVSPSIGDASFEGFSTNVTQKTFLGLTVAGSTNFNIGAWTASESSIVGLSPSSISTGKKAAQGGPNPTDGLYDARFNLASGVGTTLSLSQTLNTTFQPNTTYALSLDLDAGTVATLLGGASLQLWAGSTSVATLSGATLLTLIDSTSGFQTVELDYVTGNTAPTGNIGISFTASSLLTVVGNIYLDNFRISAVPNVQPVPEPGTFTMISMGLVLLHFAQKTRSSTKKYVRSAKKG